MNLTVAIVSLFCYGDPTMNVHERERDPAPILQKDRVQGRKEEPEEDHPGSAGQDAGGAVKKKRGRRFKDITGQTFGKLTAIRFLHRSTSSSVWECRCECGYIGAFRLANLGNGHTKSCGCIIHERFRGGDMERPPTFSGDGRLVATTKGKWVVVDEEDYERVMQWKWSFSQGYCVRSEMENGQKSTIKLHRFIMGAPSGIDVDHISMEKWDNRKPNLRFATRAQNGWNRGLSSRNKSGHKGIHFCKKRGKWVVQIKANRRTVFSKRFASLEEAQRAHSEGVAKYHGEFARTI